MSALVRSTCVVVFGSAPAFAQCPEWRTGFAQPVVPATVRALSIYDDGGGPALVVGGDFINIDGDGVFHHVALWDGERWRNMDYGLNGPVHALETIQLFGQTRVVAGGAFFHVGVSEPDYFGVWDGSTWSPPSGGTPNGLVYALRAFDDGSGPAIFTGGQFTSIDGSSFVGIARWNGTSWTNIGDAGGVVYALAVHDDGSGPALYAGGSFSIIGGVTVSNVARWDGVSWSDVDGGANGTVHALATFGGALFAGGDFTQAGGASATRIARWDGASWNDVGSGTDAPVRALSVHDDGNGAKLYVAGEFTFAGGVLSQAVARWNGTSWSATDLGLAGGGFALATFDDGTGTKLFCGGNCRLQTGTSLLNLARWNGQRWTGIAKGLDGPAMDFELFNDGFGTALYVGGGFQNAAGIQVDRIGKWNGTTWTTIGGVSGGFSIARALEAHDDGSGPALFVAGQFTTAGGSVPAANVARWNGSRWSPLGSGMSLYVNDLLVADVGAGQLLYAAGAFTTAGDVSSTYVAAWDGTTWIAMPGLTYGSTSEAMSLCTYDDGTGLSLYVGGRFNAPGSGQHIARWDGAQWVDVGGGTSGPSYGRVSDLLVFDDGTGPQLYASGFFAGVGGTTAPYLARWNGTVWSSVGAAPPSSVSSLVAFDDGRGLGEQLFAAVDLNGSYHGELRRWDAGTWTTIAAPSINSFVFGMKSFHSTPSGGAELWLGGTFLDYGGVDTDGVAVWAVCNEVGERLCFGDGSGTACPCGNASSSSEAAGCANSTGLGGALRGSGWSSLTNDTLVLTATNLPATSSSLFFQGTTQVNGGLGSTFGDGLRCAGGAVLRMGTNFATGGVVSFGFGVAGDPLVHVAGAVTLPGSRRVYQSWYRNAVSFCTPSTFNLTNAVEMVWEL